MLGMCPQPKLVGGGIVVFSTAIRCLPTLSQVKGSQPQSMYMWEMEIFINRIKIVFVNNRAILYQTILKCIKH